MRNIRQYIFKIIVREHYVLQDEVQHKISTDGFSLGPIYNASYTYKIPFHIRCAVENILNA